MSELWHALPDLRLLTLVGVKQGRQFKSSQNCMSDADKSVFRRAARGVKTKFDRQKCGPTSDFCQGVGEHPLLQPQHLRGVSFGSPYISEFPHTARVPNRTYIMWCTYARWFFGWRRVCLARA